MSNRICSRKFRELLRWHHVHGYVLCVAPSHNPKNPDPNLSLTL